MRFFWQKPEPKPTPIPFTPLRTVEEYEQFVRSHRVVVVQFWAGWNIYDRAMGQILRFVSPDVLSQIQFGSVDIDIEEMWEFLQSIPLYSTPFLTYHKNGDLAESVIGIESPTQIEARLKSLL